MTKLIIDTIEDAIEDIANGKIVIVVDDEERENEGDFVCAADYITPEKVNFMIKNGKGQLCTPLTEERCQELNLSLMVSDNNALHHTPFTVPVDYKSLKTSTGISAFDRAETIKALVNPDTNPNDLAKPGHMFPLMAKQGGVLRRAGHTEAAVDLARLSGSTPAGVIIEIMNDDGTMARLPQLRKIADKYKLKLVTIKDLIKYRIKKETLITKVEQVQLPTKFGDFELHLYKQCNTDEYHYAITKGTLDDMPTLLRVHSSCITGDIFASARCDCGTQLEYAMAMIEKEGKGAVIYLNQEGRGIGIENKIKSYKLQESNGMDTVEANLHLGFKSDHRDYGIGAQIIRDIGVTKVRLISNNPQKRVGLTAYNIQIVENVPIQTPATPHNKHYLETKRDKLGHKFVDLD